MFQDEPCGKQIQEFIGLRSKLYSFKLADEEHKKCKGIKNKMLSYRRETALQGAL